MTPLTSSGEKTELGPMKTFDDGVVMKSGMASGVVVANVPAVNSVMLALLSVPKSCPELSMIRRVQAPLTCRWSGR